MIKVSVVTLALFTTCVSQAHDIGHQHEHVEGGWNSAAGFVSDIDFTEGLFKHARQV